MSVDPSSFSSSGAITSLEAGVQEEGSQELAFNEIGGSQEKSKTMN